MVGNHNGENLFMEYDRVATTSSIEKKPVRLITDNASNNLSAFGELVIIGFESYFVCDDHAEKNDNTDEINLNMSEGHCPDGDDYHVRSDSEKQQELLRLPCFIHTLLASSHVPGLKP